MSESAAPLRGIVVGHAGMAQGLVEAVRHITGIEEDALVAVSNHGLSPEELADEIARHLDAGTAILFTDLQTGSCGFAARRLTRNRPDVAVVCGVNLPLLVDFAMNRDRPAAELLARLVEKGRGSIVAIDPPAPDENARRALSGG